MKKAVMYSLNVWANPSMMCIMSALQIPIIKAHSVAAAYGKFWANVFHTLAFILPFYLVFLIATICVNRINTSTKSKKTILSVVMLILFAIAICAIYKTNGPKITDWMYLYPPIIFLGYELMVWRSKLNPLTDSKLPTVGTVSP